MDDVITSKDNAKLKHVRGVRDGRAPLNIYIEGVRLVGEALRSPIEIVSAFVSDAVADSDEISEIVAKLTAKRVSVVTVAAKIFGSISDTVNSQGIILTARRPIMFLKGVDAAAGKLPLIVHLQKVNNPSNLGAVIRTAEAAGVTAVFVSKDSADAFSPKAIRASMGSCFRLPIIVDLELSAVADWASGNSFSTVAADISGKLSYAEIDWRKPRVVVFGSEANGLSADELDLVGEKMLIPMENNVESLNLAVSNGIVLFEALRQNRLT